MIDIKPNKPWLQVTNLSARRGGRLIFHGLSFEASGGEMIAITGPNGSGKSTLLRIITGLSRQESGIVERNPIEKETIRYAGHLDGLKNGLSVLENLQFWSKIYDASSNAVEFAIERLVLNSVADMPVEVLSAGWRRRAGLARILLGEATFWILDEPYTALDSENVVRIDSIISAHVEAGGIIILATHQSPRFTPSQTINMATFEVKTEEIMW